MEVTGRQEVRGQDGGSLNEAAAVHGGSRLTDGVRTGSGDCKWGGGAVAAVGKERTTRGRTCGPLAGRRPRQ